MTINIIKIVIPLVYLLIGVIYAATIDRDEVKKQYELDSNFNFFSYKFITFLLDLYIVFCWLPFEIGHYFSEFKEWIKSRKS